MRILIVDDEIVDRVRIRVLLESEPDGEVVGECGTGTEAVEAILALAPDLVFPPGLPPGLVCGLREPSRRSLDAGCLPPKEVLR